METTCATMAVCVCMCTCQNVHQFTELVTDRNTDQEMQKLLLYLVVSSIINRFPQITH